MARDLKQSGSTGSKDRMKKMTDRVYRKNTVTEGTTEDGSKITYRDKYRRSGKSKATGEQMKRRTKSVRLEKDAEGKTYKTKARRKSGQTGDKAMTKNKKEISQKKYDRNINRIEKTKSKGAQTKTLRGSKEDKAQKDEARYKKFKKTADDYKAAGNKIDWSREGINKKYAKRYQSEQKK